MVITAELIKKAINYPNYLKMVRELYAQNRTTGINSSEDFWIDMTGKNLTRITSLLQSITLSESIADKLRTYQMPLAWLAITEAWDIDSSEVLPVVYKMANLSPNINLKIILRDENIGIMNMFLTHGAQAIPKIICLDAESLVVLGTWGPRPAELQAKMRLKSKMLNDTPKDDENSHTRQMFPIKEVLEWYKKDQTQRIQEEVFNALVF